MLKNFIVITKTKAPSMVLFG